MSTPARKSLPVPTDAEIAAAKAFVFPADRFHQLVSAVYGLDWPPALIRRTREA